MDFVEHRCFCASYMEDNDSMMKFYMGLPSWKVFEHVNSILLPDIPRKWSPRSRGIFAKTSTSQNPY